MFPVFACIVAIAVVFVAVEYHHLTSTDANPGPFPLMAFNYGFAMVLRSLADLLTKPSHKALDDAMGAWKSEVQYACIKAGIAEILAEQGPTTLQELSSLVSADNNFAHEENLQRLLRTAESLGYFYEETATGRWHNTRLSEVLLPTHPLSVYHMIRHWKEDSETSWSHLYEAIVGNECVFENANEGKTFWQVLQENPNQEAQFQAAMANQDSLSTYSISHDYPYWDKFDRIVDFGGGHGGQLMYLLSLFSHSVHSQNTLSGILFDQPQVVQIAHNMWQEKLHTGLLEKSVFDRVTMVGGSFFEKNTLPTFQPHDVILLRTVLHDWSDTECIQILRTLRERIGYVPSVTVLVSDIVLQIKDPLSVKYLVDLHMKISFHHAKERYLPQWKHIFNESGFELRNVYNIRAISSILELKTV